MGGEEGAESGRRKYLLRLAAAPHGHGGHRVGATVMRGRHHHPGGRLSGYMGDTHYRNACILNTHRLMGQCDGWAALPSRSWWVRHLRGWARAPPCTTVPPHCRVLTRRAPGGGGREARGGGGCGVLAPGAVPWEQCVRHSHKVGCRSLTHLDWDSAPRQS